jgi:hypothetical protein
MKAPSGCLQAFALLTVALVVGVAFSCIIGWLASWVLGYFGIHVPWYVCSVGAFVLGCIFRGGRSSK